MNAKSLEKVEAALSVFYLTDHEYSDVLSKLPNGYPTNCR